MSRTTGDRTAPTQRFGVSRPAVGAVLALALNVVSTGCKTDGSPVVVMQASMRTPSIAFESIDGPPAAVFAKLVESLAREADARQVLVVSRESAAVYRVRGYLAADVIGGRTHYDWAWDVYDAGQRRMLRIAGEEPGGRRPGDAWAALDEATLDRIARASMDRLTAFLLTPDAAPPLSSPVSAFADAPDQMLLDEAMPPSARAAARPAHRSDEATSLR